VVSGLLTRLVARLRGDEPTDDEAATDSRFVPSVLDASVRQAHGADEAGEREIARVQEEAQRLEGQRRGD
jgi:hypothetical protein